jgi:hypothetical protein
MFDLDIEGQILVSFAILGCNLVINKKDYLLSWTKQDGIFKKIELTLTLAAEVK